MALYGERHILLYPLSAPHLVCVLQSMHDLCISPLLNSPLRYVSTGERRSFSEQHLIDCAFDWGPHACGEWCELGVDALRTW